MPPVGLDPRSIAAAIRGLDQRGRDELARFLGECVNGDTPATSEVEGLNLVDWQSFWTTDRTADDFLIEPLVARGRGHALYAPAKAGKSLLLVEVAAAIGSGRPVLHRPSADPLSTLYLDYEMTENDLAERLDSLGYGPADDLSHLHYALLPSLPPLDTAEGGRALLDEVHRHAVEVVVIDTIGRAIENPENEADTLRAFHRWTGLPLKAAGVTWIRADHAGKDSSKGQRGTSAKADDVDVVWSLSRTQDGATLKATHRRIGWIPERVDLHIVTEPTLRHVIVSKGWLAGTKECAELLDTLAVPLAAGYRHAANMLRAAGHGTRNEVVRDAVRWRRESRT